MNNILAALAILALLFAIATGRVWAEPPFGPIPQVSIATNVPTYSVADSAVSNTGTGNLICLYGSASYTAYVNNVHVMAKATTGIAIGIVSLVKYSTRPSGGTPRSETLVAHDTRNHAAASTAIAYTASPTAGTVVGTMRNHYVIPSSSATIFGPESEWEFGTDSDQAIALRGANEGLCININTSVGADAAYSFFMKWTEQ